jgi:hypothetical protein
MSADPPSPAISRGILKLARQINSKGTPAHVSVEPGEGCTAGECFENVRLVVRRSGGSIQHGWKLREQPTAYVEGEFYAVWQRPDGSLVDVTPRPDAAPTILFLPDLHLVWDGDPIEPRRMMLHEQPCYCGSQLPFNLCHALAEDG